MPNKHKTKMLPCHPDDPAIGDWVRAEAKRRGVALKVVIEEALAAARAKAERENELP